MKKIIKKHILNATKSAYYINVIWDSHNKVEKKYGFYLKGYSRDMDSFETKDCNQYYKKIDLSSVLKQKDKNEFIQNFSLGVDNYYQSTYHACIDFWTKTDDYKYHIYTAGYSCG